MATWSDGRPGIFRSKEAANAAEGLPLSSVSLRVEITRGRAVEAVHRAHGIICGAGEESETCPGDPGRQTYWRSAMKPFQTIPVLEDGAAEAFGFGDEEIAVCSASHGGTPAHTAIVAGMLRRIGLGEADLRCGPHAPFDAESARQIVCAGRFPGRLHNNCSGKHAGMLSLARHHGWPHQGYESLDHPVQERMRQALSEWIDVDPKALVWALDGCGVPTPLLPLQEMARAYSRLVRRARAGHTAAAVVVKAMTTKPELTSSPGRFPLDLMRATRGRLLAKEGAEGVMCVAAVDDEWGLALKVEDGSLRAVGPATVELLQTAGLLRDDEREALTAVQGSSIINTLGETVGSILARREEVTGGEESSG